MNSWMQGALATCSFELRRSLTFQRIAVSLVLAAFPPTMLSLLIFGKMVAGDAIQVDGEVIDNSVLQGISTFVTIFLVALVLLLSLLLWATPNVNSELEGKSWGFIASRPGGRVSVFLGKFLASVLVSFLIAVVAVSLCVLLASQSLGIVHPERVWLALTGIYLLASIIYSALFSLIGTLFIKRGMVVAAGYLIGFDVMLGSVPGALINKFTIRYHLQEIGLNWMGWFFPGMFGSLQEYRMMFGPAWHVGWHLLAIILGSIVILALGIYVIVTREFITTDQS